MKTKILQNIFSTLLGLIILVAITACDTNDPNETSISMSFSVNSALSKINAEDFQIEKVKLLVRDIKIKNQAFEDDLQVKTGPLVVDLNLEGETTEFSYSEIPSGTYDRIRFEIHKIEDSEIPPDPEFKESNESSDRFSVIVKGKLNGEMFTYKSRKSAVQDIKLAEDLVVEEGEEANLTITVNPFNWFYEGDNFLDPNDNSNDDKIDNNLKYSFKRAFCDKDKNGIED